MVYPHEAIALFRHLRSRIPKEQVDGVQKRLTENVARIGCPKTRRQVAAMAGDHCAFSRKLLAPIGTFRLQYSAAIVALK
jgi:hypothetical protein